jgi:hypothetical protein
MMSHPFTEPPRFPFDTVRSQPQAEKTQKAQAMYIELFQSLPNHESIINGTIQPNPQAKK